MGSKPKQIYTVTTNDNKVIKEWLDHNQSSDGDEKKLWFSIMQFYFDWMFNHNRQTDSIYHNSIYRILMAIGMNPKTDKQKQKELEQ